jgi:hypothetical protein
MTTKDHPAGSPAPLPSNIFEQSDRNFRELFDKESFQFRHNLSGHSLFELPRLVTLAETLLREEGPSCVSFYRSKVLGNLDWSQINPKDQRQKLTEAIAGLQTSDSRLLLYRVQIDPEYRLLMNQVIRELELATGVPLSKKITWKDAYIFLASPQLATQYHIDHESTFLFQIHGERVASIWNRDDRSVLKLEELEDYYTRNVVSAAKYREENQPKARNYSMTPGTGVHHPVLAPHTFKNGSTYSIALGVHFCLRDWDRQARVHQVNACLRRLRLHPTPPGRSAWRDRTKIAALGLLSKSHPKNKYELIRSGFVRLVSPLKMIPGIKERFK